MTTWDMLTIKKMADKFYTFERFLNKRVTTIGNLFLLLSKNGAKRLHTGYWRNYVFIMFYTIILFSFISLWIVR